MPDLARIIENIGMNSLSNGAESIEIQISEHLGKTNTIDIIITDNSITGQDSYSDFTYYANDNNSRYHGLLRLNSLARECDGTCLIKPMENRGVVISASFRADRDECPPIGDLARMMMCLCAANPNGQVLLIRKMNDRLYKYDTTDLRNRLQKISLSDPKDIMRIRSEMNEMENDIWMSH